MQNVLRLAVLLGTLTSLIQVTIPRSANAQTKEQSACEGDTVDRMGPRIAEQARVFLVELAVAVRTDNKTAVSRMIQYPLRLSVGDKQTFVENPAQFIRDYSLIIDKSVARSILSEKSIRCLFANNQGFMVGNGEVWFKQISERRFKIIAVNAGSPPDSEARKKRQ